MTGLAPVHIFLDANTALHFKRPDQIDWLALTGAKQVILIGAPIFHRELENQKVHNPSRKLRERANTYIKWLAGFVRDPALEVRSGTTWHFVPYEPQIDFAAHNLSLTISDDHLIASVIAYAQQTSDSILVATADVGLEVKLRYRQIEPLLLPEDVRLPEEPDPQEKELLSLRRQAAQQRAPILALLTDSEEGRYLIHSVPEIAVPSAPSLAEIRRKHPMMIDERATPPADNDPLSRLARAATFQSFWLTPERIQSYNTKLERFFGEYQTFLNDLLLWEQEAARTVEVSLSLSNDGTAPASDVDVILSFPADIILMTDDSLSEKPEPPEPPARPETGFGTGQGMSADAIGRLMQPSYEGFRMPQIDSATSIAAEDHRITFWLRNIKHGVSEQFESVFFRFPNRQAVRSFGVTYKISAAELPQATTGRLNFVLP